MCIDMGAAVVRTVWVIVDNIYTWVIVDNIYTAQIIEICRYGHRADHRQLLQHFPPVRTGALHTAGPQTIGMRPHCISTNKNIFKTICKSQLKHTY